MFGNGLAFALPSRCVARCPRASGGRERRPANFRCDPPKLAQSWLRHAASSRNRGRYQGRAMMAAATSVWGPCHVPIQSTISEISAIVAPCRTQKDTGPSWNSISISAALKRCLEILRYITHNTLA